MSACEQKVLDLCCNITLHSASSLTFQIFMTGEQKQLSRKFFHYFGFSLARAPFGILTIGGRGEISWRGMVGAQDSTQREALAWPQAPLPEPPVPSAAKCISPDRFASLCFTRFSTVKLPWLDVGAIEAMPVNTSASFHPTEKKTRYNSDIQAVMGVSGTNYITRWL